MSTMLKILVLIQTDFGLNWPFLHQVFQISDEFIIFQSYRTVIPYQSWMTLNTKIRENTKIHIWVHLL